jgi:methylmalonyl-CoA mutase
MYDLLQEKKATHIKIFAGGGGTILPVEKKALEAYGITRIYHPDDGREMGLQGMINDLIKQSDFLIGNKLNGGLDKIKNKNINAIARMISGAENCPEEHSKVLSEIKQFATKSSAPVLGITGTGGSGKSSLVDELVRRFIIDFPTKNIAIVSVDPSKRKTGGALLGDRIRMNSIKSDQVYMRSLATRQANLALSAHVNDALNILKVANYDLIIFIYILYCSLFIFKLYIKSK